MRRETRDLPMNSDEPMGDVSALQSSYPSINKKMHLIIPSL